tara:strand:+ start:264 stop:638 length:375 start_codon:yes stop_codon:yes gene_type:complete
MSNYIKSTDFAGKDALPAEDASKIVKGTEIDDEFNAIQTAVNSKANASNSALTGVPTAPTASAGANGTQIATTAFVHNKLPLTNFTFVESGTNLLIQYLGVTVAKITSTGALTSTGDITAFGVL